MVRRYQSDLQSLVQAGQTFGQIYKKLQILGDGATWLITGVNGMRQRTARKKPTLPIRAGRHTWNLSTKKRKNRRDYFSLSVG